MSRAKYVGMALVVCGVVLTVSGVGAFSTVTADRQLFVGVGEQSTSYLGISIAETRVTTNGTNDTRNTTQFGETTGPQTAVLGSVTNYFPATLDSIDLTVSRTEPGPPTVLEAHVKNVPLESGSSGTLLATIDCGGVSRSTETVTFTFVAEGRDTYAETERTVPITCMNEPSAGLSNPSQLLSFPRQVNIGSA